MSSASEPEIRAALQALGLGPPGPRELADHDPKAARRSEQARQRARNWTHARGIVGFGLATRITSGIPVPDTLALKVYVERKRPRASLRAPVPKRVRIPSLGRTIETDVEEIGRLRTERNRSRLRPTRPGYSVGHVDDDGAGTLGCIVKRRGRSPLHILGSGHVLAPSAFAAIGDRVLQPARRDGGRKTLDVIAHLSDFTKIRFGRTAGNTADAAIAKVQQRSDVSLTLSELGIIPTRTAQVSDRTVQVKKVGRTSGLTVGVIKDIDFHGFVDLDTGTTTRRAHFHHQVLCHDFTSEGDSGAAVVDENNRLVGLHLGGSDAFSVFNRIEHVFEALDIELP